VTLRLKAPHTLILGPSVFEVPNICGADVRSIPLRFWSADDDGNVVIQVHPLSIEWFRG
jgi:hypothetical protein